MSLLTNAGVLWIGVAILLGAAELAAPGVFLVFFAIAAAMTGVSLFALPALPLTFQLASFALWSGVAVAIGRRWYLDYPVATADPLLNDRAARLIGTTVLVTTPIERGEGRVRVGDGDWTAIGADAAIGERLNEAAQRTQRCHVTVLHQPDRRPLRPVENPREK